MANIYKSNYTGAQIDVAIGKVATNEQEITNIKTGYIPLKQFTSGPFQIPQIGYNKELNWIDCNVSISAQSIVQRDGNGIIYINPPDTVPENVNEYAGVNVGYANKTYVKAINVTENTYVYAASSEGPNGKLRISADTTDESTIVQRSSTGTIITADPVQAQDAVSLNYLKKNCVQLDTINKITGDLKIDSNNPLQFYNHHWNQSEFNLFENLVGQLKLNVSDIPGNINETQMMLEIVDHAAYNGKSNFEINMIGSNSNAVYGFRKTLDRDDYKGNLYFGVKIDPINDSVRFIRSRYDKNSDTSTTKQLTVPNTAGTLATTDDISAKFANDLISCVGDVDGIGHFAAIRVQATNTNSYFHYGYGVIGRYEGNTIKSYLNIPLKGSNLLSDGNVKTINGQSIYGSGDITISGGGDVTLAGNNTFTGTNVFTSNTLEVSDGIDKTNDGKAVIISSTGIKIYDGAAGRNYTVNFPSYEKGAGSTLATLADLAASSVSTTSDNTFTGNNMFSKPVTVGANADAPGWGTSTVIDGNKIYFCPIGASKTSRYISSEDKFINGTQFIKLFVTATKNSDTDKIYFPDTAGTLALTSDIKIKSASLSGTTLTLTI